jgi:hypothetical protein
VADVLTDLKYRGSKQLICGKGFLNALNLFDWMVFLIDLDVK